MINSNFLHSKKNNNKIIINEKQTYKRFVTIRVDDLARPRGFEPLTLGLEMRGFVVTNCIELSRFVTLQ